MLMISRADAHGDGRGVVTVSRVLGRAGQPRPVDRVAGPREV